jgi:glycosyltransferase involved in cell wall biosynthesis
LAETLHLLLRTPELRAALSAAGQAGVRQHFGAERMARETLSVYRRFLAPASELATAAAPA